MNAWDEYTGSILLYLDNQLTGQALEDFLTHLSGCRVCRTQLEEEREVLNLLHRTRPLYKAPDRLRARLIAARYLSRDS
jgi:hypothetical protein